MSSYENTIIIIIIIIIIKIIFLTLGTPFPRQDKN